MHAVAAATCDYFELQILHYYALHGMLMSCISRIIGDESSCLSVAALLYYHRASDERPAVTALIAAGMRRGASVYVASGCHGLCHCVMAQNR